MNRGRMIGRGMVRSVGQIAISVVATLIATQIYTGLQHPSGEAPPRPGATLTSGGKFDARIADAALPPLPEPARPVLSIVDWAITPPYPDRLVQDVAWGPLAAGPTGAPEPAPRPAHRSVRRSAVAASTAPAARPTPVAQPDLHGAPPAAAEERPAILWPIASAVVQTVAGLGGSAAAIGSAAVSRLNPWPR